jgi:hypothetical protein
MSNDDAVTAPIASGPSAQLSTGHAGGASTAHGTGASAAAKEWETLKQQSEKTAENVKAQGAETVGLMSNLARDFAEQQKGAGAERVKGMAQAVDAVAGKLDEEMPEAAKYVREAAKSMDRFSSSLRDRSVGDLVGTFTDYARRQPVAFFGASVLAGFALSRFLKSSSDGGPMAGNGRDWNRGAQSAAPAGTKAAGGAMAGTEKFQ